MTNRDTPESPFPENPFEDPAGPPEEAGQIEELVELTTQLQDKRYSDPKSILRGVHPKSHGCVRAFFEVRHDIAEDLQVGLFATPGKCYNAKIRFSNAAVLDEHDLKEGKNGSRGMAIKVMDVDGDVLLDDGGKRNQDFLMINQPTFVFANAEDYLRLNKIALAKDDKVDSFFGPFPGITPQQGARLQRSGQLVGDLLKKENDVANPLEVQYFGAAPFLFGPDRVMRFSAEPWGGEKPQVMPDDPPRNYLREALKSTMRGGRDICFDFMVQVREPGEGLEIENASMTWDETQSKYVNVARITIPAPQDGTDDPKNVEHCESLVFTPWHCLQDHQPVGSINRLRKAVYLASEGHRTGGCPR